MPTVYLRADPKHKTRFHRTPNCWQLTKKPSMGDHYELVAKDLEEVFVRPCLTCYPDAPRLKILKRYCPRCDTKTPCPHNGGIAVFTNWEAYHKGRKLIWVWPDNNYLRRYHTPDD